MAYTSGFFDAIDLGGGNYDRVYNASDFAHYFSLLIKNGVFPDPSTGMQVVASPVASMKVAVNPGSGWVNGYYITVLSESAHEVGVPIAHSSLTRIDSVIMGFNSVARELQLYLRQGTPAASPSPVSLQRDKDKFELELAQITVRAGTASIVQSDIKDMRNNGVRCGIVAGTVSQIDTTDLFAQYDDAFQTWFDDIQSQLSGDIATNLQNQINKLKTDKLDITAKATTAQSQAGANDTQYMTPAGTKAHVDYRIPTQSVAEAGLDNTKLMTPLRTKQAIEALTPVGGIKTTIVNPGGKYLACNGATLFKDDYPELDQIATLEYRQPISSVGSFSTVNNSNHLATWDRTTEKFHIYLVRTNNNTQLYLYNKATKQNSKASITNGSYQDCLLPVLGSEYTVYFRVMADTLNVYLYVINPDGVIGPEIPMSLATSRSIAMSSARLKNSNSIEIALSFKSTQVSILTLTISSNAVSTTNVVFPDSVMACKYTANYLYLHYSNKVFRCPINSINSSTATEVVLPYPTNVYNLYSDVDGNIMIQVNSNAAMLILITDELISIGPTINNPSRDISSWAGKGFYFDRDQQVVYLYFGVQTTLAAINLQGVSLSSATTSTDTGISGKWMSSFTANGPTVSLFRIFDDIRLPSMGNAYIKVKGGT